MSGITYNGVIDWIFDWCVWFLIVVAPYLGLTYEEINIYLFIIIQPGLIVLFMVLWWKEKIKRKYYARRCKNYSAQT